MQIQAFMHNYIPRQVLQVSWMSVKWCRRSCIGGQMDGQTGAKHNGCRHSSNGGGIKMYISCVAPKIWLSSIFLKIIQTDILAGLGSSVGCMLDWWSGGCEFAALVRPHSFVEIDHEIFSMVILSLSLIQEGKLSVTSKRMCTEYWLTA